MNISSYLFDFAFVIIAAITAWIVARRLVIESAIILLATLIASLISINAFEPIADACRRHMFLENDVAVIKYLWIFFLTVVFVGAFFTLYGGFLRAIGDTPELGRFAESTGCWFLGAVTGYVLSAFLLTAVQTCPGSRDFGEMFFPEPHRRPGPILAVAPDFQFLSFTEYVCSPHAALSGRPWQPAGPVVSANIEGGPWASFPIRYALFREDVNPAPQRESADP